MEETPMNRNLLGSPLLGAVTALLACSLNDSAGRPPDPPVVAIYPNDLSSNVKTATIQVIVSGLYPGVDVGFLDSMSGRLSFMDERGDDIEFDVRESRRDGPNPALVLDVILFASLPNGWSELQIDVSGLALDVDAETSHKDDIIRSRINPDSAPVLKRIRMCEVGKLRWLLSVAISEPVEIPEALSTGFPLRASVAGCSNCVVIAPFTDPAEVPEAPSSSDRIEFDCECQSNPKSLTLTLDGKLSAPAGGALALALDEPRVEVGLLAHALAGACVRFE